MRKGAGVYGREIDLYVQPLQKVYGESPHALSAGTSCGVIKLAGLPITAFREQSFGGIHLEVVLNGGPCWTNI